mmetsp:Transcript_65516/g.152131  ORF Transcript_65516/g.152131 Transcript_65516/m.152131 type:complete len:213 (+) Transcript_65516:1138-1776(+)
MLRAHMSQRSLYHLCQVWPHFGHQLARIDAPKPVAWTLEVRPGAGVCGLGHLVSLPRHDALPSKASASTCMLPEPNKLDRSEHHLDGQPYVEPREQESNDWDGGEHCQFPCPALLLPRELMIGNAHQDCREHAPQEEQRRYEHPDAVDGLFDASNVPHKALCAAIVVILQKDIDFRWGCCWGTVFGQQRSGSNLLCDGLYGNFLPCLQRLLL